jgi:hypothetical protein
MNIDKLCVGLVVKNYKVMCELLDEEVKSGNSKKGQLSEWKRYFDWETDKQKFIITEIYDEPKERISKQGGLREETVKHGLSNHRLYRILKGMIRRCYNVKDEAYIHYGGRGISICDEWLGENGFITFYNWAMANGYKEHLTIDRINNDGNYEPGNCRWTTMDVQLKNRRKPVRKKRAEQKDKYTGATRIELIKHIIKLEKEIEKLKQKI